MTPADIEAMTPAQLAAACRVIAEETAEYIRQARELIDALAPQERTPA